jgi:hypothetical protein
VRNFENNENKVKYRRESYEIIQCLGKPEILIAEGVSNRKFLLPESEKKSRLLRKKVKSSCKMLCWLRAGGKYCSTLL